MHLFSSIDFVPKMQTLQSASLIKLKITRLGILRVTSHVTKISHVYDYYYCSHDSNYVFFSIDAIDSFVLKVASSKLFKKS